ncbi:MAG: F0F1 ATP synthase subunit delta [Trueperaceae bacterium]
MTFDWFTLIAQLVNFALLIVLLRVFLYGPIQRVMAERSERIAATQRAAEAALQEAKEEVEAAERERHELARSRRERMDELEEDLEAERARRLEAIEREENDAREDASRALDRERDELLEALLRRTSELVADELRRTLLEIAGADLDARSAEMLRRHTEAFDPDTMDTLRSGAREGPVVVTTAVDANDETKAEIGRLLRELTGDDVEPRFETDPALLFGVTIRLGAFRLAWNAAERTAELERKLAERLDQRATRGGNAAGRGQGAVTGEATS